METEELRGVAFHKLEAGYATEWELMDDLFAWLDLKFYLFYKHHQWLGPKNDMKNMLGLVVTREEFEHHLLKAAQQGLAAQLTPEDAAQLEAAEGVIRMRAEKSGDQRLPLLQLFARCGLDLFECGCVALAYATVLDRKYEKLLAYLQDDISRKAPTTHLAVQLLLPLGHGVEEYLSRFARRDGFTELFDQTHLAGDALVLQPVALEFLSTGTVSPQPGRILFDGAAQSPDGPLVIRQDMAQKLDQRCQDGAPCAVCLSGAPGSGKRFQVEHLMSRQRAKCVFADLEEEPREALAREAALAARLTGAYLCCYHLDLGGGEGDAAPPTEKLLGVIVGLKTGQNKLFLLSGAPLRARLRCLSVELELPPTDENERIALFSAFLKNKPPLEDTVTVEELAAKFRFQPRQIKLAAEQAGGLTRQSGSKISGELIHKCCYRQVVHKLGDLATRVTPAFTWDDVVLPNPQKELMRHACSHIKYQHQVYFDWGFDQKLSYGRGLAILFAGAPGTGKTMCAQVIARQLNMEMYKINLSQIVSKYIGETEKNLQAVFMEAKNSNCILFFDECDAIFGKRGEVKDAHDRNANVEVAYLLQQIEEHEGVCILATNLIQNIDAAFMRRITYVVHFPFPDAAMREQLYRSTVPRQTPLSDDVDWAFLAEKFQLSGGHIKNIVLSAAFMAAEEGSALSMRHLLRAAINELKKNEIVVVREQLREYADLLDDQTTQSIV